MRSPEKSNTFQSITKSFEQDETIWSDPDQLRRKLIDSPTRVDNDIFKVIALIYRLYDLKYASNVDLSSLQAAETPAELAMLLCQFAQNNPDQMVKLVYRVDENATYGWCIPQVMQREVEEELDPVINFRTNLFKLIGVISSQGLTVAEIIPLADGGGREMATSYFHNQKMWMTEDFPGLFREDN